VSFMASYVALWLLVAFLSSVAIGLLREVTDLKRSMGREGLAPEPPLVIGSRAPNFSALDVGSGRRETADILRGRSSLVVFTTPHCPTCRHLVHSLESVPGVGLFSKVTVCKGDKNDCGRFLDKLSPGVPLLLDAEGELSRAYGVLGYPAVVFVDAKRRVRAYGHPKDVKGFEQFVAGALRELNTQASSLELAMK